MAAAYSSFTWNGVTIFPLVDNPATIIDWIPEPKQQERHIAGSQRVQISTFGYVWRWTGTVYVASVADYGTLQVAWLAQPRTTATWNDGTNSYNATLTQFTMLPLGDSSKGYTGQVEFVRV
jgi:cyanate permease